MLARRVIFSLLLLFATTCHSQSNNAEKSSWINWEALKDSLSCGSVDRYLVCLGGMGIQQGNPLADVPRTAVASALCSFSEGVQVGECYSVIRNEYDKHPPSGSKPDATNQKPDQNVVKVVQSNENENKKVNDNDAILRKEIEDALKQSGYQTTEELNERFGRTAYCVNPNFSDGSAGTSGICGQCAGISTGSICPVLNVRDGFLTKVGVGNAALFGQVRDYRNWNVLYAVSRGGNMGLILGNNNSAMSLVCRSVGNTCSITNLSTLKNMGMLNFGYVKQLARLSFDNKTIKAFR